MPFFIPSVADILFLLSNLNSLTLLLLSIQTSINWSVINAYHLVLTNPIVIFAPLLWCILLSTPLWHTNRHNARSVFTRKQRRQFARTLQPYIHTKGCSQTRASIRTNGLHKSYPFRLRKHSYVIPNKAPTVTQRTNNEHLDELKRRSLNLQRRASRYRNRPSPYAPSDTGQKGERKPKLKKCKGPKYCPVPEVASSTAFQPAAWTAQQINAAHKIVTKVNLACILTDFQAHLAFAMACSTTTLLMALQAPIRMRDSLGPKANTSPVIWDSGASISISPDPTDFLNRFTRLQP